MRTLLWIGLVLYFAVAQAEPGRAVPPMDLSSANGPAPLDGTFLAHAVALPRAIAVSVPKRDLDAEKPSTFLLIGRGLKQQVSEMSAEERRFDWREFEGGFVAELAVRSPGAAALRVALESKSFSELEIRVGDSAAWSDSGRAQILKRDLVAALRDGDSSPTWTPVTSGDVQIIQLVSPVSVRPGPVWVANISHLDVDPHVKSDVSAMKPKLLVACEQNYSCAADPTIQNAGHAVAKIVMTFPDGSSGSCSGSLLSDRGLTGTPWFATAAHCQIDRATVAASLQFFWFYEVACGGSSLIPSATSTVGAQLLLWATDIDFNLLKVVGPLPSGLRTLGWDPDEIATGTTVFGVHHPKGANKAVSVGSKTEDRTVSFSEPGFTFNVYSSVVHWTQGITEQGSSGSPLMTTDGLFRGTLSAGPVFQSCSTPDSFTAFYAKFSSAYPRIRNYIDPITSNSDDRPDSAAQVTATLPVNSSQGGILNTASDQDWFKYSIPAAGVWIAYSTLPTGATTDTVGRMYASNGTSLLSSNDNSGTSELGNNFLIGAHALGATTGLVQVTGAGGSTGPYILNSIFIPDDDHSGFPPLGSPLGPNATDLGVINPGGDADYFVINISSAGTLVLESTGSTDLVGRLFDSNINLVASNDDAAYPTNLNFRIQAVVPPGKYYLGVFGYDLTTVGNYSVRSTFTPTQTSTTGNTKSLGSRATVSPTATLFGGFELANASTVYMLVRGNSLGTLGVTQAFLDAPRVRIYNSLGQDMVTDTGGRAGFNGCSATNSAQTPVVNYYQNVRGTPIHARDGCIAQSLPAGAYTFTVTPSIPGVTTTSATSAPGSGEVLFEVVLGGGSGSIAKTLGSRATVSQGATLFGGFEISTNSVVYILVRGNSLGTLGITQSFLDAPRVRVYDAQGHDLLNDTSGNPGFNFCLVTNATLQKPVFDYYSLVRHAAPHERDGCVKQTLAPGAYTFSVTPTAGTSAQGEVLFEVVLNP